MYFLKENGQFTLCLVILAFVPVPLLIIKEVCTDD